jgi:hypothetical protein
VTRKISVALTLSLLSAFAVSFAAPTQAIDLPVEGGPGGGPFRIKCDGFITGFEGRAGAYIDHFRVRCASFDSATRKFQNRGLLQISIGTSMAAGPASASCPAGWALFQIDFENTVPDGHSRNDGFVHHISFKCAPPTGPETIWRTYGPTTPIQKPFSSYKLLPSHGRACPPGEFAVGLHGRSGLYVDALGLICEPLPAAPPPPPPQAAAPAAPPPQAAAPAPPPQATPTQADKVAATLAGFTGTWNTKTDKNWTYVMTFLQDGREVNGTFVAQDGSKGRIKGRFGANVMEFNWEQDGGFTGTGRFALAADGNSFSGVYQANPHPKLTDPNYLQGSWSGTRR